MFFLVFFFGCLFCSFFSLFSFCPSHTLATHILLPLLCPCQTAPALDLVFLPITWICHQHEGYSTAPSLPDAPPTQDFGKLGFVYITVLGLVIVAPLGWCPLSCSKLPGLHSAFVSGLPARLPPLWGPPLWGLRLHGLWSFSSYV
ncbi:hypothetical protein DSO57_1025655 [Entomophthora muscae]|uniref:Uncharacterized protein n=1 Tax=Entomophthora muscae TaxID=34485 RepID=A0ACC2TP90_9FUNG|nr:hypothetical protein DSO57_1025655 [Entomophthora muscae]